MKPFSFALTMALMGLLLPSALLAQGSLQRVTFSGGARDDNRLTATVGEPFAGYAKGGTNASLSMGAQPGEDTNGVGIENQLNRDVSIFPNPTDGFVTVRVTNAALSQFTVTVNDLAGRTMFHKMQCVSGENIDFVPFAAGMYLLSVTTTEGKLVNTFKIEKH